MHPKTHIFVVIFTILITKTRSLDRRFEACAPQSCGNLTSITYPFWVFNKQEPYCGHPSLKITCKSLENPTIKISNVEYIITHIDYASQKFHLEDSILFNDEIQCPTPLHNITLNKTILNFSNGNVDFLLFYNCSSLPKGYKALFPISCDDHKDDNGYEVKSFGNFHVEEVSEEFNYSIGLCQSVVVAPVSMVWSSSLLKMDYKEILRQGFGLNWSAHDCGPCEKSGGHCGYEYDDGHKFACFCRDKPHSQSCHDGPKPFDTPAIIGMTVAGAFGILALGLLCFLYVNRKKWYKKRSLPAYISGHKSSRHSYSSSNLSTVPSMNGSTYFGVQLYSYKELEQATDFFNPSKELGDGGFGTVYYAKLEDGREVAIKRLYENNNKRAQQFMNEVEILAHLRHKNLVSLYGCTSRQSRDLLLVYEYVANGTVADHLRGPNAKSSSTLPWSTRLNIAVETAEALLYLHASDIIHRDVKTQNVLLDRNFSVKVADFGLSRLFPLDVTHVSTAPQGTPGYVDPEYYQCYQLTEKSDVYSFGVMLAELISSKPAVDITRKRQDINLANMAINKIQDNTLHEFVDPLLAFESDFKVKKEITAVAELAFRCLQGTREMRPTMEEVLQNLREFQNSKADKPEVVDIPDYDVHMFKSDFSPGSNETDNGSAKTIHSSR